MKYKVFIDGAEGTTGLKIYEYFSFRKDIQIIEIDREKKRDVEERLKKIKASDVSFLCLPDEAATEIAELVPKEKLLIDTSTAHRTNSDWTYGLPEISNEQREKIKNSTRVANPGCHATGFILLLKPLIEGGIIEKDAFISGTSVTGYSGGGKNMIKQHERGEEKFLESCGVYGLTQSHKHLPEIIKMTGIHTQPAFIPIVGNFYNGMVVTIPLKERHNKNLYNLYKEYYKENPMISVMKEAPSDGFIHGNILSNKNNLEIFPLENEEISLLVARYDNLGKGASGAAIQNMNIMLGIDETKGLL